MTEHGLFSWRVENITENGNLDENSRVIVGGLKSVRTFAEVAVHKNDRTIEVELDWDRIHA